MSLADQFASAISRAQFHELHALAGKLWKAYAADHVDEADAAALSEAIESRKPKHGGVEPTSFRPPSPAKRQRSPDRQASIERRRRLARASPVPPELVHEFTQGEHAVLTVVCGEIQRVGLCAWFMAKIAAVAGVSKSLVRNALRKASDLGLLHKEERRRRGQKSLTNIVRVLRRSWGHWLRRIGCKKFGSTSNKILGIAKAGGGEGFGEDFSTGARGVRGVKETK
jgi:hypothetical protein